MPTYYLYRSNRSEKKFVMLMKEERHLHHFGATGYADFTLLSDKNSKFYEPDKTKREKRRQAYINRHRNDPKGIHDPSSMADLILWSAPTMRKGIRNYEKKFGVKVVFSNTKYIK